MATPGEDHTDTGSWRTSTRKCNERIDHVDRTLKTSSREAKEAHQKLTGQSEDLRKHVNELFADLGTRLRRQEDSQALVEVQRSLTGCIERLVRCEGRSDTMEAALSDRSTQFITEIQDIRQRVNSSQRQQDQMRNTERDLTQRLVRLEEARQERSIESRFNANAANFADLRQRQTQLDNRLLTLESPRSLQEERSAKDEGWFQDLKAQVDDQRQRQTQLEGQLFDLQKSGKPVEQRVRNLDVEVAALNIIAGDARKRVAELEHRKSCPADELARIDSTVDKLLDRLATVERQSLQASLDSRFDTTNGTLAKVLEHLGSVRTVSESARRSGERTDVKLDALSRSWAERSRDEQSSSAQVQAFDKRLEALESSQSLAHLEQKLEDVQDITVQAAKEKIEELFQSQVQDFIERQTTTTAELNLLREEMAARRQDMAETDRSSAFIQAFQVVSSQIAAAGRPPRSSLVDDIEKLQDRIKGRQLPEEALRALGQLFTSHWSQQNAAANVGDDDESDPEDEDWPGDIKVANAKAPLATAQRPSSLPAPQQRTPSLQSEELDVDDTPESSRRQSGRANKGKGRQYDDMLSWQEANKRMRMSG